MLLISFPRAPLVVIYDYMGTVVYADEYKGGPFSSYIPINMENSISRDTFRINMSIWIYPEYSRTQVRRAGDILRESNDPFSQVESIDILNNWKAAHELPLDKNHGRCHRIHGTVRFCKKQSHKEESEPNQFFSS